MFLLRYGIYRTLLFSIFFMFFFFSSMEQCLKDLRSEVNEICTDEILQSTNDCLQWLNNCNFVSLRPSSTPHGELMEFLRTLVKKTLLSSVIFGTIGYSLSCFFLVSHYGEYSSEIFLWSLVPFAYVSFWLCPNCTDLGQNIFTDYSACWALLGLFCKPM